jgi:hypothetical protein
MLLKAPPRRVMAGSLAADTRGSVWLASFNSMLSYHNTASCQDPRRGKYWQCPKLTGRGLDHFGYSGTYDLWSVQGNTNNNNIYLVKPPRGDWLHRGSRLRVACMPVVPLGALTPCSVITLVGIVPEQKTLTLPPNLYLGLLPFQIFHVCVNPR